MNEKLMELLKDEAFAKELLNENNPEDVQAKLNAKGVDISLEEVNAIAAAMEKAAQGGAAESDELSEDDLENVAGGIVITATAVATAIFGTIGLSLMTWDAVERRW